MILATNIAKGIFWTCLAVPIYSYLVYPCLLFIAYALVQAWRDLGYLASRGDRRAPRLACDELPSVSLLIPAYNEEPHLADKLADIRQLDYPPEKLQVVFVSDGSTDRTNELLSAANGPGISTVFLPEREGKASALNCAVANAKNEILVFSDTSALFAADAVQKLVRHFRDPRVGVVCGLLQFGGTAESLETEGLYWRYESTLRLMETRLGASLGASGAVYAIRSECFRPLATTTLIDDFITPMNVRRLGYRVLYDPEAVAQESCAGSVSGEFHRRVRIAAGSFRALGQLLHVPMDLSTALAFVSHKLLRWISPFMLMGLLISNLFLIGEPFYRFAFFGQLLFYLWGGLGFTFRRRITRVRYALVGYFMLAMNLAFVVGFWRFLRGETVSVWLKVN